MPVTIDGTNGISGVDGSASTPAVQGTDTNTGMFFPAADTIAFAEGGTEVMRIDSSGNLRVGSSSTALNSINSTNTFGFKNRIINGSMMIDQRNAGGAVTCNAATNTYTLDRWLVLPQTANVTAQRVSGSGQYRYAIRLTGSAGNTVCWLQQRIESLNSYDLAGQTVTLSFIASSNSAKSIGIGFAYANSTDNFASVTNAGPGGSITTTSTPTQYSLTTTLSTSATTGLRILFNITGGLGSGETVDITGVQLEVGSTATSFDYRPYGTELMLCQRYYWRLNAGDAYTPMASGYVASATVAYVFSPTKVTMRTSPTLNYSNIRLAEGSAFPAVTSIQATRSAADSWGAELVASGGGMTIGRGCIVTANNNTAAYIDASAEL